MPRVVLDGAGNAMAMWVERCACTTWCSSTLIACSQYSNATGTWSTPAYFTTCQGHTKYSHGPSLFANSSGQIMAFWTERFSNTVSNNIVSKSFVDGAWDDPVVIASNLSKGLVYRGGIDDLGGAVAVWTAKKRRGENIQSATYSQGAWSRPCVVLDAFVNMKFSYGLGGTGLFAWPESTKIGYTIKGKTYSNASWSPDITLSKAKGIRSSPAVSAAGVNSGVTVWGNETNGGTVQLIALSNGAWSSIASETTKLKRSPAVYDVSVSDNGQVIVVWLDNDDQGVPSSCPLLERSSEILMLSFLAACW